MIQWSKLKSNLNFKNADFFMDRVRNSQAGWLIWNLGKEKV